MKKFNIKEWQEKYLIVELNPTRHLDKIVSVFIIVDENGAVLTKSGKFEKKPIPTKILIIDDVSSGTRKVQELEKKGIKSDIYELNNRWDLK